ncbi:MAG TPA: methylated-DNA--[protein]-cysteine S-methyltransferase [Planctomycetota bacterium]|nr:methylated-DNA--[protein]-cysteine S-methyltransferase [Planctomycetota bacterium]
MRPLRDRARWKAVLERDAAFDGAFVFGVTSTAIYCRPSCPARRPRPENAVFFRSPHEARREGFRACRRCHPDAPPVRPGGILAACDYIARHLDGPRTLADIARHVGWSPFHLQRVFRRKLGVTPKEYGRRLRFERLGRELRSGTRVAPALYAAGFGSTSRVYERADAQLGMSPAAVSRKGAGVQIAYDVVPCPLGKALIGATPLGICAVFFGDRERPLVQELRARFPEASIRRSADLLRFASIRLDAVFAGARDAWLPLDVRATAFQARVWESLRAIPFGETRTYAQIARLIGRPTAVRAVGTACGANPVSLIIPCHRVVGTDRKLHGYRWGVNRKTSLLARERGRHPG